MAVSLNSAGAKHAKSLLAAGKVDKTSDWSISADEENSMLGNNDWTAYGAMHLGEDTSADAETKARFKYPFGKGGKVYRSALIAIRSRAAQQGATSIYDAAGALIKQIDGSSAKHKAAPDSGERWMEVFAVGKWNGMLFTLKDLEDIVTAFDAIGDNLRVALKFGHNGEQPMTDGQPAIGWIDQLKIENNTLMAHAVDVPPIVMAAMDKKLYRNVSIELDFGVDYKGEHYPLVLSAVALLGADIPAVNTLKDLTHYMGRNVDGFHVGRSAVFTAIAGKRKETTTMTEEELKKEQEKLAAERAEFARKEAEFAAKQKAEEEAKAKAKLEAKRTEAKGILEAAVTAKHITPAQREKFTKVLKLDDDKFLEALDMADVKALVEEAKPAGSFNRDTGRQGNNENDDRSPDVIVAERVQELLDSGKAKNFAAAQRQVFARDKDLARAYIDMNGRK